MTATADPIRELFDTYEATVVDMAAPVKSTTACDICFRYEGLLIDIGPRDAICYRCFKRAERAVTKYALEHATPKQRAAFLSAKNPKGASIEALLDDGA